MFTEVRVMCVACNAYSFLDKEGKTVGGYYVTAMADDKCSEYGNRYYQFSMKSKPANGSVLSIAYSRKYRKWYVKHGE